MAVHNLIDYRNKYKKNIPSINLLVGMTPRDGISLSNHIGFNSILKENDFKNKFKCSYIYEKPPIHTKAYIWTKDNSFHSSFIGSANYTQQAFFNRNREILANYDNEDIFAYFKDLEKHSIYCNHSDVQEYITVLNDKEYYKVIRKKSNNDVDIDQKIVQSETDGLPSAIVSLLTSNGNPGNPGGALNWGVRPGRANKDEAYIPLHGDIRKTDFFPKKAIQFTVLTDDSKVLVCTRAQGTYGKAIHTTQNNSLIGVYLRNRLGLQSGEMITTEHLLKYGRTDVTFYKIDEETYYMDFSV